MPTPSGCGCYLVWDTSRNLLVCPLGCGTILPPACACKAYGHKSEEERKQDREENKPYFEVMTTPDLRGKGKVVYPTSKRMLMDNANVMSEAIAEKARQTPGEFDHYITEEVRKKAPPLTCISCGLAVTCASASERRARQGIPMLTRRCR